MSGKSCLKFPWFCFTSLFDWSRKLSPLFKPIRCKSKTKHDLVTRVYPYFLALYAFLVVFSLSCHWLLRVFFFLPVGHSELTIALAYCFWKLCLLICRSQKKQKDMLILPGFIFAFFFNPRRNSDELCTAAI